MTELANAGLLQFLRDLESDDLPIEKVMSTHFGNRTPAAFKDDQKEELRIRERVVDGLRSAFGVLVHPKQLTICGSAHLGFSPVHGGKIGRPFDPAFSDIDLCVVSPELFEICWYQLHAHGEDFIRTALGEKTYYEYFLPNLFIGFVDRVALKVLDPFGKTWDRVFHSIGTLRAKTVNGRLYRSHWSPDVYHSKGLRKAKEWVRSAHRWRAELIDSVAKVALDDPSFPMAKRNVFEIAKGHDRLSDALSVIVSEVPLEFASAQRRLPSRRPAPTT